MRVHYIEQEIKFKPSAARKKPRKRKARESAGDSNTKNNNSNNNNNNNTNNKPTKARLEAERDVERHSKTERSNPKDSNQQPVAPIKLTSSNTTAATATAATTTTTTTTTNHKTKGKLPRELLERISDRLLEHSKQLGIFDEFRCKLMEHIESYRDFSHIKREFAHEVNSFCKREANLEEPRQLLRQQFNDYVQNTKYSRLTRCLSKNIEHTVQKHRQQLMADFELKVRPSLDKFVLVAAAELPLDFDLDQIPLPPGDGPNPPSDCSDVANRHASDENNIGQNTSSSQQVAASRVEPAVSAPPPPSPSPKRQQRQQPVERPARISKSARRRAAGRSSLSRRSLKSSHTERRHQRRAHTTGHERAERELAPVRMGQAVS